MYLKKSEALFLGTPEQILPRGFRIWHLGGASPTMRAGLVAKNGSKVRAERRFRSIGGRQSFICEGPVLTHHD
jgi:hypothetical protein